MSRARVVWSVVLASAAIVLAAGVAVPGDGDARKRKSSARSCNVKGSSTLATNSRVRIYAREVSEDTVVAYGCHKRTRKRTRLATYDPCCSTAGVAPPKLWLAGNAVAVDASDRGGSRPVRSINLATGKQARALDAGHVWSLVLKRNGSLAAVTSATVWSQDPVFVPPPEPKELEKSDATGQVTLESGNIDPESLALSSSSVVYWLKDGRAASGTLD